MMFNFIKKWFFKCEVCETNNWKIYLSKHTFCSKGHKVCKFCANYYVIKTQNDGSIISSCVFLHKNKRKVVINNDNRL